MPGRPISRARRARLDMMTLEQIEDMVAPYAEGTISGIGMLQANDLDWLTWRKFMKDRPEVLAIYTEAKRLRATPLAESIVDIADNTPETTEGVGKARLQVFTRQWLASMQDKESYGRQEAPVLHVQHLHLTALDQINTQDTKARMQSLTPALLEGGDVPDAVVETEPADD